MTEPKDCTYVDIVYRAIDEEGNKSIVKGKAIYMALFGFMIYREWEENSIMKDEVYYNTRGYIGNAELHHLVSWEYFLDYKLREIEIN